jgi:para-nitrobenzyl esterase
MRAQCFVGVAVLAMAAAGFADLPGTSAPTVEISSGALQGTHFGDSPNDVAFLGVPYAAPPVGELRWKPPDAPAKWSGVRKADAFGPVCPQQPQGWLPYIEGQEDCLYLNIWSPPQCLELGRSVRVRPVGARLHAMRRVMLQVLGDAGAVQE